MIKLMLLAGTGGFIGTCFRFLIGRWCTAIFHGTFPIGTLLVNIIGCLLFGIIFGLFEKTQMMTQSENVMLITGFCGGFTTFSSFAADLWMHGNKGEWGLFAIYLAASVIMGILAVWIGRTIVR